ncbi:hypothetical protein [Pseudomonas akapageensis]|uniref:hypothetical protein n=1 Tax=Pseudomonas akapageensis TaxID=2609961 RepID=UPI00140AA165|nr:hypothetical protein [Pseudomonas akapageensis]
MTSHLCATLEQNGVRPLILVERSTLGPVKESTSGEQKCRNNSVMTGRSHEGDENGDTEYTCAKVKDKWGDYLQVIEVAWGYNAAEGGSDKKGHEYVCPDNQVMIGRYHEGDEHGETRYLCGTLW